MGSTPSSPRWASTERQSSRLCAAVRCSAAEESRRLVRKHLVRPPQLPVLGLQRLRDQSQPDTDTFTPGRLPQQCQHSALPDPRPQRCPLRSPTGPRPASPSRDRCFSSLRSVTHRHAQHRSFSASLRHSTKVKSASQADISCGTETPSPSSLDSKIRSVVNKAQCDSTWKPRSRQTADRLWNARTTIGRRRWENWTPECCQGCTLPRRGVESPHWARSIRIPKHEQMS